MARGAGLAAALAPACTAKPAGFPLGWGAAFPLALGAATDFFGGTKSLGIHFSSHISRVKYSFPSNTWPKPQTPRALFAHTTSTSLPLFLLTTRRHGVHIGVLLSRFITRCGTR